ncbi:hypothetical protein BDM02DRAFT_3109322 [Thelephora ganbajun]|uniref:Uncharacterized protein n=1 Tax=Thelephora ganbajun TaxID=370292 RepID=A0ACB6ZRW8_THEGA|nr:hypothetical protein BDM02DRAFT_3109322 [Thelephora ganbajun]
MACTACQGEQTQSWTFWGQNCDAVYVTQYPLDIPSGTAIPHWAYLNVTTANRWDQTAARAVVDQPESTGVVPPVLTLSTSTGSTGTKTGNTPSMNTSNNSTGGGGGGSHVGAIVGGVVGGLAGLGIFAAIVIWFIMKKKRSEVAPSSAFINSYQQENNYPKYEHPPASPGLFGPPQMMYNPSDPSTFPSALHDPSVGGSTAYPQTLYDLHTQRRGQYSGAPEV